MYFSIHPGIINKPIKVEDLDGNKWFEVNGKRINPGFNWESMHDVSWDDVFALITEDGYATSAYLAGDNRCEKNFVARDLFMIDIDSGMTIPQLLNNQFYNDHSCGFYTTPSHTDDAHRFRIMFRTWDPITDAQRYRYITRGLMQVFNYADASCKDAARLFYGTKNCLVKEKKDEYLTVEMCDILYDIIAEQEAAIIAAQPAVKHTMTMTDTRREKILSLLSSKPIVEDGNKAAYEIWRDIGWGLKEGGFSLDDFWHITATAKQDRSYKEAQIIWNDGKNNGRVTMGTVIHFLKKQFGESCLQSNMTHAEYALCKMKQEINNLLGEEK